MIEDRTQIAPWVAYVALKATLFPLSGIQNYEYRLCKLREPGLATVTLRVDSLLRGPV